MLRIYFFSAGLLCGLPGLQAQNITRPNIQGPSGLQVNSYTGSLFYQRTDLSVPGRLPMNLAFTYNSADRATDLGYGFGWTFALGRYYILNDSGVVFVNGDGRKDQYKVKEGKYLAPKGIFDQVSVGGSGHFLLVTKDGTQYAFDDPSHKKLTGITDKNGNKLQLSYSAGQPSAIADGSGRTIILTWTDSRLTELRADFGGTVRKVQFTYNADGTLASVKDPGGNTIAYSYIRGRLMGGLVDANGNQTTILYNTIGAVIKFVSCESEKSISYNTAEFKTYATDINNDKTYVTVYAFDQQGNLINKSGNCCGYNVSYHYDDDNNINQITDANGNKATYAYDNRGNLLSQTDAQGHSISYTWEPVYNQVTSVTDKNGNKTSYGYDAKGNLLKIEKPLNSTFSYTYEANGDIKDFTDARGNKTIYQYDAYGFLTTITDAAGNISSVLAHDTWGNLRSWKDARNNTKTYSYDVLNQMVSVTDALQHTTRYSYDGNGNVLSVTDGNNNKTNYIYDPKDRPLILTDALGHTHIFQYDAVGNLISFVDGAGNTTLYTYDKQATLLSETNAANEQTSYNYDGNGNRTGIVYPNGNSVSIQYDELNRIKSISDAAGMTATYSYDPSGNKISQTDARGNTIAYHYDELNRLITETDALGNSYDYTYDGNGNMVAIKDRNKNSTTYQYDVLNRMEKINDPGGYTTKYSYDAAGNLTSITDANDNTTIYSYDALNRSIEEREPDNSIRAFTYDAEGNLLTQTDNMGRVTNYTYDKIYRPVLKSYSGVTDSLVFDAEGHLLQATNPSSSVSFLYDKAYRVIQENLNGRITSYSYNIAAGIQSVIYPGGKSIQRQSDQRNHLASILQNGTSLVNFIYDNSGNNIGRHFRNGTGIDIIYNNNRQVTGITLNPGRMVDLNYSIDKEGNPTAITFGHHPTGSEQFTYDSRGQIASFQKSSLRSEFNYDGPGNRTNVQTGGGNNTYTVNNMNEYMSESASPGLTYKYDANGNILSDGKRAYAYDMENRIIQVDSGMTASYKYDALGRRIKKTVNGKDINYYYDGLQVIEERNSSDSILANYVWGTWLDDLIEMQRAGNNYYFTADANGSIIAVTDSLGAVSERYEYDPYGVVSFLGNDYTLLANSAIGNVYTFTGRQYEPESGQFFYRARHYNASDGRFLQRDPLGIYGGDFNLYSYVSNNPVHFTDPLGWIRYNNPDVTVTTPPTGANLAALQCFETCSGHEVLVNGGQETTGHRGRAHGMNLACDVASPRFNPHLNDDNVLNCARRCGYDHGWYESFPGRPGRDHWHLQIGSTGPGDRVPSLDGQTQMPHMPQHSAQPRIPAPAPSHTPPTIPTPRPNAPTPGGPPILPPNPPSPRPMPSISSLPENNPTIFILP